MTQFSDDDSQLTNFLQQHRPQVPPASPQLEARVMAAVAQEQVFARAQRQQRQRWLLPGAIAASLAVGMVGYRLLLPAQPTGAELASLETFMETSWQGTVSNSSTDDDLLLLSDGNTN